MLFRQLFDESSWTYTYLIAEHDGGRALLIDPVLEKIPLYQRLLQELDLTLVYALDTHVHADHITALGKLREVFGCETVHGECSKATGVTRYLRDGEVLKLGGLSLETLHTPGHTDDSYCYLLKHEDRQFLFSGDTLLIRGTGRTDFQHGNATQQYHSIFSRLLTLPEHTLVYPGHDYSGMTVSSIGEEKRCNPRLQISSAEEYARLMHSLNLARPKQMDIAVPANLKVGLV
jgi:glyoxylase-like metal-dependent hydrolase (beta-lactamase superfamily II)